MPYYVATHLIHTSLLSGGGQRKAMALFNSVWLRWLRNSSRRRFELLFIRSCARHTVMIIAHRISHETNVVVDNQSANSQNFLLHFHWMLTTTTFVLWDILWAMVMMNLACITWHNLRIVP